MKRIHYPRFQATCIHLIFEEVNGIFATGCHMDRLGSSGCPVACEWYAFDERFFPMIFPELKEKQEITEHVEESQGI